MTAFEFLNRLNEYKTYLTEEQLSTILSNVSFGEGVRPIGIGILLSSSGVDVPNFITRVIKEKTTAEIYLFGAGSSLIKQYFVDTELPTYLMTPTEFDDIDERVMEIVETFNVLVSKE